MAINVKKYTKDQMAKMVEETEAKFKSKRDEYHELAEQLKIRKKEIVELKSDLVKKNQTISSLKAENAALTEQIDQMNGEVINRENVIANLKADLDAANVASKLLNDQGQQYWRAWQASKREVADLKNKLTDTEAALKRANACIATMKVERDQQTKDCFEWQRSAQNLHDDLLNARERANYAEAHPWRNLWAWVKRKLRREQVGHYYPL